jgi:hypothetical protein
LNVHYVKVIDEVLELALALSAAGLRQEAEEPDRVLTSRP